MRWTRVTALVRRRIRYKIARGGVLFVLALLIVGAGAAVSANNLLFLIVAAMLATLLISGLVSRLVLAGLELELLLPEHISARAKTKGTLLLKNWKRWMPSFSVRVAGAGNQHTMKQAVYFPVIPGTRTLEETVDLEFPRRGAYTENLFVFTTRFPFGFLEKTALVRLKKETVVYPSIALQPEFEELLSGVTGEMETHFRGVGSDFYRIRPYETSESARFVDWKSTAHMGALQVREFARDQQRSVEIYLDRSAPVSWFEKAVECSAFLVWELSGQGVEVQFSSPGFSAHIPEDADVYTILKFLAFVQPEPEEQGNQPFHASSFDFSSASSFRILLSSSPQRFLDAGWAPALVIDRHSLAGPNGFAAANGGGAASAAPAAV